MWSLTYSRGFALDVHPLLARGVDGVHPPHQRQDPGESVLDEDDAQGGESVEDAVEDQAHHLIGRQQRIGGHEVVVVARETRPAGSGVPRSGCGTDGSYGDVVFGGRRPHRVIHRIAPRRPTLGLDQDLRHVRVAGPLLDLRGGQFRRLDRHADRSAPALMPVVVGIEPMVGLPVVECATHGVIGLGQPGRVGAGFQDRDIRAGLHDQLLKRQIGVTACELAVGREGVHPHRVGVRVIGSVVVDQIPVLVGAKVLAAPRLGYVLHQFPAAGHRMDIGVHAPYGDALGGGLTVGGGNRIMTSLSTSLSILPCRQPIRAEWSSATVCDHRLRRRTRTALSHQGAHPVSDVASVVTAVA